MCPCPLLPSGWNEVKTATEIGDTVELSTVGSATSWWAPSTPQGATYWKVPRRVQTQDQQGGGETITGLVLVSSDVCQHLQRRGEASAGALPRGVRLSPPDCLYFPGEQGK